MSEDKNPEVTKGIAETFAENEILKVKVIKLEAERDDALEKLKIANDFIANQKRGEIITKVKKHYTVGDEYIAEKTTEELKKMVEIAELQKPKIFSSSGSLESVTDELEAAKQKLRNRYKF